MIDHRRRQSASLLSQIPSRLNKTPSLLRKDDDSIGEDSKSTIDDNLKMDRIMFDPFCESNKFVVEHFFRKHDGDWIGPSLQQPNSPNILRTGWSFIPSNEMNCTIETYSQDDIYDISEKKSIVILGSSIDRGIFLSLVDIPEIFRRSNRM